MSREDRKKKKKKGNEDMDGWMGVEEKKKAGKTGRNYYHAGRGGLSGYVKRQWHHPVVHLFFLVQRSADGV